MILFVNQIVQQVGPIGYQDIALAITSLFCLSALIKGGVFVPKKILAASILLVAFCVIRLAVQVIFTTDDQIIGNLVLWDPFYYGTVSKEPITVSAHSWISIGRLIMMIIIMICFRFCLNKNDRSRILGIVISVTKIHVAFVFFEFILKNLLHAGSLCNMALDFIFGEGSKSAGFTRGILSDLQGLTMEPSQVAMVLIVFVVLLILRRYVGKDPIKHDIAWMIISVVLLLSSMAFASFYGLAVLGIVLIMTRPRFVRNKFGSVKAVTIALPLFVCSLALLLLWFLGSDYASYYIAKLGNIVDGFGLLVSGQTNLWGATASDQGIPRILSMYEAFLEFLRHPLFGLGIGIMNVHSGIFSTLASLGLTGLLLWGYILLNCARDSNTSKIQVVQAAILVILLTAGLMDDGVIYSLGIALAIYCMQMEPMNSRSVEDFSYDAERINICPSARNEKLQ